MLRSFSTIILLLFVYSSCDNPKKNTESAQEKIKQQQTIADNNYGLSYEEQFKALVKPEMTLSEVADSNDISLNYLKMELGVPDYIRHNYKVEQLSKNFKFNIDDIVTIINKQKNKEIAKQKSQQNH